MSKSQQFLKQLTFLILFIVHFGYGQSVDSIQYNRLASPFEYNPTIHPKIDKYYLKGYLVDSKNLITAPFHWKPKSWITLSGFGLAALGIYSQDEKIKNWSQNNRGPFTKSVSQLVQPLGNGRYILGVPVLLYSYGLLTKKHQPKRLALITLESIVIVGGLSKVIKHTFGRKRPDETTSKNDWHPFKYNFKNTSFFSGHSSLAFMLATVFSQEFKSKKVVGYISYSLAGLTALSRIHDNRHWASDVFFGTAAGYFITKTIMKRHTTIGAQNLSILPFYNGEQSGLQIGYRF